MNFNLTDFCAFNIFRLSDQYVRMSNNPTFFTNLLFTELVCYDIGYTFKELGITNLSFKDKNLAELKFCNSMKGNGDVVEISPSSIYDLFRNVKISKFKLNKCIVNEKSLGYIFYDIFNNKNIKDFSLVNMNLTENNIARLILCLSKNTFLEKVELVNINFKDINFSSLFDALVNSKNIKYLNISNNPINGELIVSLIDKITMTGLVELNISNCNINIIHKSKLKKGLGNKNIVLKI